MKKSILFILLLFLATTLPAQSIQVCGNYRITAISSQGHRIVRNITLERTETGVIVRGDFNCFLIQCLPIQIQLRLPELSDFEVHRLAQRRALDTGECFFHAQERILRERRERQEANERRNRDRDI